MQPTMRQVECSLEALRVQDGAPGASEVVAGSSAEPPRGLVEQLVGDPAIRLDRLADVRTRLDTGEHPSDLDIAERLVGRLVCDRLR